MTTLLVVFGVFTLVLLVGTMVRNQRRIDEAEARAVANHINHINNQLRKVLASRGSRE